MRILIADHTKRKIVATYYEFKDIYTKVENNKVILYLKTKEDETKTFELGRDYQILEINKDNTNIYIPTKTISLDEDDFILEEFGVTAFLGTPTYSKEDAIDEIKTGKYDSYIAMVMD